MSPDEKLDLTRVRNDVDSIFELITDIRTVQDQHTARLDGIDGRLDGIDGRLAAHDARFDRLDANIEEILRRLPG